MNDLLKQDLQKPNKTPPKHKFKAFLIFIVLYLVVGLIIYVINGLGDLNSVLALFVWVFIYIEISIAFGNMPVLLATLAFLGFLIWLSFFLEKRFSVSFIEKKIKIIIPLIIALIIIIGLISIMFF